MNTEPIDLALDTKGLTSNAARNPFYSFIAIPDALTLQRKRFEFRDITLPLFSCLQPLVPVWTAPGGEREIKPLSAGYLPPELALGTLNEISYIGL